MVECLLEGLPLTVHIWYNMDIFGALRSMLLESKWNIWIKLDLDSQILTDCLVFFPNSEGESDFVLLNFACRYETRAL